MHAYSYIHTDIRTFRHTDILTFRHTDIQTYRHTDIHTYRHTYTGMQAGRQAGREGSRQTDRQTHNCMHPYTDAYLHPSIYPYIHTYIHVCIQRHTHRDIRTYIMHTYTDRHAGSARQRITLHCNTIQYNAIQDNTTQYVHAYTHTCIHMLRYVTSHYVTLQITTLHT